MSPYKKNERTEQNQIQEQNKNQRFENPNENYDLNYEDDDNEYSEDLVITATDIKDFFYCQRIPVIRRLFANNFIAPTFLMKLGNQIHEAQSDKRKERMKKYLSKNKSNKNEPSISSSNSSEIDNNLDPRAIFDDILIDQSKYIQLEDLSIDEELLLENLEIDPEHKNNNNNKYNLFNGRVSSNPVTEKEHSIISKLNYLKEQSIYYDLYIYSKRFSLLGVVDCLIVNIDKNLAIPVEFKTGLMPKTRINDRHKLQLTALALIIEDRFDLIVEEIWISYLSLKKIKKFKISYADKVKVFRAIDAIKTALSEEILPPPTEHKEICHVCEFYNICRGV